MLRSTFVYGLAAAMVLVGAVATAQAEEAPPDADAPPEGQAAPEAEAPAVLDQQETAPVSLLGILKDAWQSFKIRWQVGGPLMWLIAALAVVAVVFAIDRLIGLRRSRIVPHGLATRANRLWVQGEFEQLLKLARRSRSTLGEVIAFLVEHRSNSYEHLTAAAEDIAARDFERHGRSVYPLVAVGTLAPLCGLLGTVFGLLGAFATIGVVGSMDDPSALAGDIGEALITTAAGLIVAIPTLILYHYFSSRTGLFAGILGTEVSNLMHGWFLKKEGTDASQA